MLYPELMLKPTCHFLWSFLFHQLVLSKKHRKWEYVRRPSKISYLRAQNFNLFKLIASMTYTRLLLKQHRRGTHLLLYMHGILFQLNKLMSASSRKKKSDLRHVKACHRNRSLSLAIGSLLLANFWCGWRIVTHCPQGEGFLPRMTHEMSLR